jgi:ribosomal protein S18 acetylase RimI-like enzyme
MKRNLKHHYIIKKCKVSDIEDICNTINNINLAINNPALFVPDDKEFVNNHIESEGCIIGLWIECRLVAYLIIRYPDRNTDNLGYDLGFEENDLIKVAHIESVAVCPEYRGYGFQRRLIKYAEKEIKIKKYKYILATVSPSNKYSLENFIKSGYKIGKLVVKYNGNDRYIVVKKTK